MITTEELSIADLSQVPYCWVFEIGIKSYRYDLSSFLYLFVAREPHIFIPIPYPLVQKVQKIYQ